MGAEVYAPMSSDLDIMDHLHQQLTERQRRRDQNSNVERVWSRKQIETAFVETFNLIGGVPRLALWANDPANYHDFLKLLMTLRPKEVTQAAQATVLEYRSAVPASRLNRGGAAPALEVVEDAELPDS